MLTSLSVCGCVPEGSCICIGVVVCCKNVNWHALFTSCCRHYWRTLKGTLVATLRPCWWHSSPLLQCTTAMKWCGPWKSVFLAFIIFSHRFYLIFFFTNKQRKMFKHFFTKTFSFSNWDENNIISNIWSRWVGIWNRNILIVSHKQSRKKKRASIVYLF